MVMTGFGVGGAAMRTNRRRQSGLDRREGHEEKADPRHRSNGTARSTDRQR
jgi:hypothetical protein